MAGICVPRPPPNPYRGTQPSMGKGRGMNNKSMSAENWWGMFGNLGNFRGRDMNKSSDKIYNKAKNEFKLEGSVPQSEINKAYKAIDTALSRNICDEDCQRKRRRMKILKEIGQIDKVIAAAPKKVEDLEYKYYELADGDDWYRNWKETKLLKEKEKEQSELLKQHEKDLKNMRIDLHNYNTQYTYVSNLGDLSDKYKSSNERLENEGKVITNNKNTNFRKALYEQEYIEKYLRANNFLYKLYWGLIIFYIVYFIIMDKQFKNMKLWRNVIIIIAIPYVLSLAHDIFKYVINILLPLLAL